MTELNNDALPVREIIKEIDKIKKDEVHPFIALDGSEHPNIQSVEEANERYWKLIIPKTTEFNTTDNETILIPPSIQISYYKNVFDFLKNNNLNYNEWERYYHFFQNKLNSNALTPEFTLLFANVLLSAVVLRETTIEETRYQEQVAILIGNIADLQQTEDQTRK